MFNFWEIKVSVECQSLHICRRVHEVSEATKMTGNVLCKQTDLIIFRFLTITPIICFGVFFSCNVAASKNLLSDSIQFMFHKFWRESCAPDNMETNVVPPAFILSGSKFQLLSQGTIPNIWISLSGYRLLSLNIPLYRFRVCTYTILCIFLFILIIILKPQVSTKMSS